MIRDEQVTNCCAKFTKNRSTSTMLLPESSLISAWYCGSPLNAASTICCAVGWSIASLMVIL